ncbi:MAG: hypothetical protein CVT63_07930 [Candidatus Anoxymicrobium japonicum]|uniref:4Fe-4S ferredoxin-type domain-containing protein n=1 Tax=Candidatus Anoxymicrobium japonicum TaxID=2013648 RepID=A0A2N3G404_9ACTN|nr:MAG: hypothetical protein CVT63_07930 [Candidatus Anoxymicrobium japonicum]
MLNSADARKKCKQCGTCLTRCPVIQASPGVARDLVGRLDAGQWVGEVLDRCTGCMSCDAFCPNDARPYALLIERYSERYIASGIPRVFQNAMPLRDGPNLWRSIEKWLTREEKRNLALWSAPPAGDEVLFLGCNQRLNPGIADTSLFRDLSVFTDPGCCCGEFYLRLGLVEEARAAAASLAGRFSELGIRKIIALCPACHNMIQNLAPSMLGVEFDVEVTSYVEWLALRVDRGEIVFSRRLEGTVTVQDPCHASGLGKKTIEEVRRLLGLIGLDTVEMETAGIEAECCGLSASLARYKLADVVRAGASRARQARRTRADFTCAWCNGCYLTMNMFRPFSPRMSPVYHLTELILLATGEKPVRKVPWRSLQLFAAALEATARDGFRFVSSSGE